MTHLKIVLYICAVFILAAFSLAQARLIHVTWHYQYPEEVAGYRLYMGDTVLCESNDPAATEMSCTVEVPDGPANFTLTSFLPDGTESRHSVPVTYIFSGTLKAVMTADITEGQSPLTVTFSAGNSTGDILRYDWLFGDGETGTGMTTSHTFTTTGMYTVTLQVTDSLGATDRDTLTITVTEPSGTNQPPTAVISSSTSVGDAPLLVHFDGSASIDPDGTIVSYRWEMGDGGTAAGSQASYTYTVPGIYTATLTVTDDGGLTDSISTPVLVEEPPEESDNIPPVAVISATSTRGLAPFKILVNAFSSYDPDGKIKQFHWNFGDGTRGSSPSEVHTYMVPGIYLITLQVTDDKGSKSSLATFTFTAMDEDAQFIPSLPYILDLLLNDSSPDTGSE